MRLTAELSLYPLQQDYIPVILKFIERASLNSSITLTTNAMSTQLCGEWEDVFNAVDAALQASYDEFGTQVLVCKFIPGELAIKG